MKKILSFLLAAVLVSVLMIPAEAAGSGIQMMNITLQEEETVYIPVSLASEITAAAVGLTYTYDSTLLQALPEACQWKQTGVLSDFSKTESQAVWATDGAKELSGDLCVLAFRILNVKSFKETTVSCSVTVENADGSASTYQASAKLSKVCEHKMGQWSSNGEQDHIRKCEMCGAEERQSHDWDRGTVSRDPQKPNVIIKTRQCKVCAEKKVTEVPGGNQEIFPTYPEFTRPTEPEWDDHKPPRPSYPQEDENDTPSRPEQETTKPTQPSTGGNTGNTGNSGSTGNSGNTSSNKPQDYNQSQNSTANRQPTMEQPVKKNDSQKEENKLPAAETQPMVIKVDETEATAETAAADSQQADKEKSVAGWAAAAVLSLGAAGVVWMFGLKKKKF